MHAFYILLEILFILIINNTTFFLLFILGIILILKKSFRLRLLWIIFNLWKLIKLLFLFLKKTFKNTTTENLTVKDKTIISLKKKREAHSAESLKVLKTWLSNNLDMPYPSKEQKKMLANESKLTYQQVTYWFSNARKKGFSNNQI